MTPLEFYKRFGHETSRLYVGGTFIIHEMYKEWNVDKDELINICHNVDCLKELIEYHDGINGLNKHLSEMKDGELEEVFFDDEPRVMDKAEIRKLIDDYGDLIK